MENIHLSSDKKQAPEGDVDSFSENAGLINGAVDRPQRKQSWLILLRLSLEAGMLVIILMLLTITLSSRKALEAPSMRLFGPPRT